MRVAGDVCASYPRETQEMVTWIVLAEILLRGGMQLAMAMRMCAITLCQIGQTLGAPVILSPTITLPMKWIGPMLSPNTGIVNFLAFGVAAALLFAICLGIGI